MRKSNIFKTPGYYIEPISSDFRLTRLLFSAIFTISNEIKYEGKGRGIDSGLTLISNFHPARDRWSNRVADDNAHINLTTDSLPRLIERDETSSHSNFVLMSTGKISSQLQLKHKIYQVKQSINLKAAFAAV